MAENIQHERIVREYLLGRITDEKTLDQIETRLFDDEDFCAQMQLAEDELINEHVLGLMSAEDRSSFESVLAYDPELRFKVALTKGLKDRARVEDVESRQTSQSLLGRLGHFFRQPAYAGAFAVLLIAGIILGIYLTRRGAPDDLAELRSLYQQSRPTESRISGFGYAPLTQLRGAPDSRELNRKRQIENRLLKAVDDSPSAQAHHALGTFYLTEQKYADAIKEFEAARKLSPNDARIHNDSGTAHFELAKSGPREKKLDELTRSLEEFTNATRLDPNLLEALFNKSLALSELGWTHQAKESWTLYLQKDPSSPWAEEARKRLAALPDERALFKSDDQVLSDFLSAMRQHDDARARAIHDETKGLLRGASVPLQLSRRYLAAKRDGDIPAAKELLNALTFIGDYERSQHQDAFFLSSRTSTPTPAPTNLMA